MKRVKNIILFLGENWKSILFALVYVICILFVVPLSFGVTEYVNGLETDLYLPALLLLSVALLSLLSLIAKKILSVVFKEKANQVAKKSYRVIIPAGILITIYVIINILIYIPIPTKVTSELGFVIALFVVPAYIIFLIMIGIIINLVCFISFALLRYVIKHTKIVVFIFIVCSVLFGIISLVNIGVRYINKPI